MFYGMAYNGFKLFRRSPPRVAQVDLMVQAFPGEIRLVSAFGEKIIHLSEGGGFLIVVSDMHALDTETFMICKKLCAGKISLLFLPCLSYCPVKFLLCYKFRQPYHRDPPEVFLVRVVDPCHAVLPPQPLQRRDYIRKIALDPVAALVTHLDGE